MADREKSDVDKLLAEVDGMLSGGSTPPNRSVQPVPGATAGPERGVGGLVARVRVAGVSGAVAAVSVWCIFAVLPLLRATSGAVGAFLATFVAVLVFRRRR